MSVFDSQPTFNKPHSNGAVRTKQEVKITAILIMVSKINL